jgi:hypothetical protein
MADEKLANLVMKLQQGTEKGKVLWETTASDSMFQATLSGYIVQISQNPDPQSEDPDYMVTILNKDGQVIEAALNGELGQTAVFANENAYRVMRNIFNRARRAALGGDQAIDAIISQL